MGSIKSLAHDTALYGISSIVGRFINWLLVPLYTKILTTGEYGIVTNLYSYVAIILIMLTYGMETGFFRFANREPDEKKVYSTCLSSLAITSMLFIALVALFLPHLSSALDCPDHPSYVMMLASAVAIDAFSAIPFSYLRFQNKALKFVVLKCTNIAINIALNLFFFLAVYNPEIAEGYIFISNFIASLLLLPLLFKEITCVRWRLDRELLRRILRYSFPLLILGLAGQMNQSLDKIMLPYIAENRAAGLAEVGIYGACCKVAVIMMMFTQAFRFAYEPFIFAQNRDSGEGKYRAYADAMKFFVIFAMVIFLGVMFYMPLLQHFIGAEFRSGLRVVPIIMIGDIFFGVYYNLSVWYKLTDKTIWGTWFSLIGLAVTVLLNLLLVPRFSYMGCAWAAFSCYGIMMVLSYIVGRKQLPIRYPLVRMGFYFAGALALYALGSMVDTGNVWLTMAARAPLLVVYMLAIVKFEHIYLPVKK